MATQRDIAVWKGQVRIPEPLMAWVRERTGKSYRSLNAELVEIVREAKQAAEVRSAT